MPCSKPTARCFHSPTLLKNASLPLSNAVLTITREHPIADLEILLKDDDCPVRFIHVDHGVDHAGTPTNMVKLARWNNQDRELITTLTNAGFYTYMVKDNATRFVSEKSLDHLWQSLVRKEFVRHPNGIVYSYSDAVTDVPKRLLVVFSSISGNINTPSLMRYFEQNFKSLQKFIPTDTAVLRIADLGGVVGAFYLNTTHLPNNVENIQQVISDVSRDKGIAHESIVLYGGSKGGTGALFHAIEGHYRCVAVDPIVDDEYYTKHLNDAHFTRNGVFPENKKEIFGRVMNDVANLPELSRPSNVKWSIICSGNSPQYKYISRTLMENSNSRMSFYDSRNPEITDHPQVGMKTVNMATSLINFHLYGLPVAAGVYTID